MMTVSAVKTALVGLSGAQIEALAAKSKVPAPTIYKIRSGETADPRGSTLEALSAVLRDVPAADASAAPGGEAAPMKEAA